MNRKVTLVRVGKIPGVGVRRGAIAKYKNGRINPTALRYKGQNHDCPDGYYAIKYYVGRKARYENVGRDLQRAEVRLRDFSKRREADIVYRQSGIKTPGYEPLPERSKSITELRQSFLHKYACGSEDRRKAGWPAGGDGISGKRAGHREGSGSRTI